MIELGVRQKLYIDHKTDFGVYLSECPDRNRENNCVLLPKKQVPSGARIGDQIEVFIYRDSKDREIATTNMPKLQLGELAVLEVAQVNKIGGFMDWGLEKDLLLPYSEQTVKVQKGEKYLVGLYIDKSDRLCATMKIYDFLRTDSPYNDDDIVCGTVYGKNPEYGVFVAVDNKYNAMIQNKEIIKNLKIGDEVHARVLCVREDGKLNLSLREKAYLQMDVDSMKIMKKLKNNNGFLPYHDKSAPEDIRNEFGMSKNEFKRALGRLYKNKEIEITNSGIRINPSQK
ncbi:MAG: S1-like domain-containing RNA-binding protein [Eubacterium sp.]|nr:S1-like domain-containing RNA-binding protein [Eubacterium sp.]MDD7210296.1 S1-like domain-containing RNA-binding protein [Lachnospiraceae bacterium]MDY5496850.1 S1-like domain-containing RNA-binding protein [Anaerobutyricum sp.]